MDTNVISPSADETLESLEALEVTLAKDQEIGEADPTPEPVTYTGSDFDVEGLVRRHQRGDIVIPSFGQADPTIETAGFQRNFVWRRPQMDRFIESLLLGFPVPGIFLVQQADRRYLVLDGQQRLRTLSAFYQGVHEGSEFSLTTVAATLKGLTYKSLDAEQRRILDNTFIQATIVKMDGSPGSLEAVYQIFERLNSGGTQLTPHEIRVALYSGTFIEYLTQLNSIEPWRALYGNMSPRLRDQEVILRFMALYISPGEYKRPLKTYLNEFTARHRRMAGLDAALVTSRFRVSTNLLAEAGGRAILRSRGGALNAAFAEAALVGLSRRLDTGPPPSVSNVGSALESLAADSDLDAAISRSTADEESVRRRLAIATKAFAALG